MNFSTPHSAIQLKTVEPLLLPFDREVKMHPATVSIVLHHALPPRVERSAVPVGIQLHVLDAAHSRASEFRRDAEQPHVDHQGEQQNVFAFSQSVSVFGGAHAECSRQGRSGRA